MRQDRTSSAVPILLATVLLLSIMYVLSLGPAYGLFLRGWVSADTYNAIYTPIHSLVERSPFVANVIDWYQDLFTPGRGP